jgi:hypothetical protein
VPNQLEKLTLAEIYDAVKNNQMSQPAASYPLRNKSRKIPSDAFARQVKDLM